MQWAFVGWWWWWGLEGQTQRKLRKQNVNITQVDKPKPFLVCDVFLRVSFLLILCSSHLYRAISVMSVLNLASARLHRSRACVCVCVCKCVSVSVSVSVRERQSQVLFLSVPASNLRLSLVDEASVQYFSILLAASTATSLILRTNQTIWSPQFYHVLRRVGQLPRRAKAQTRTAAVRGRDPKPWPTARHSE